MGPAAPPRSPHAGSGPAAVPLAVSTPSQAGSRSTKGPTAVERRLRRAMGQGLADFQMIEDGDRVMCAVSGGKDSFALLELLADAQRRAPIRFELCAVNIDQGHPGFPRDMLPRYMAGRGHRFVCIEEDTFSIVEAKVPAGKTKCSLCSRLRRGILYRVATELGCNKIALGHHRDDVIVTLMLNLMFAGQLKAMPPKLVSDDGAHVVIRPLVYCVEDDLRLFAAEQAFPIIPCDLCGSQPNHQRRLVGDLLADLDTRHPGVRARMLAALRNVRPSHLLDRGLWQALGLAVAADDPEPAVGCAADAVPDLVNLRLARPAAAGHGQPDQGAGATREPEAARPPGELGG